MTTRRAFTVIELLVVVSIIALLVGILLPAIGKARDQARVTISQSNLRNLATAHASYAAEFSDRQYTLVDDNIAFYGPNTSAAFNAYIDAHGGGSGINNPANHPPIYLGYGQHHEGEPYRMFAYKCNRGQVANASLTQPIVFGGGLGYFGSFRIPNAQQFTQYTNGRFYDPIFYAPKDTEAIRSAQPCLDSPDDFCDLAIVHSDLGDIPAWASYCLSPAAMFNPDVMRHNDDHDPTANGWGSPWSLSAGFRSPSFSQAEYPGLKTHMLEHHWLQNTRVDCNPGFQPGTYDGCEPYYFNHSWVSSPVTLFYDGHVGSVGIRDAMRADGRMRSQTKQDGWGLWSKDTAFGANGYLHEFGYDQAATSFHILTTDGIRGRDVTSD